MKKETTTATTPEEKYRVLPYAELYVDAGFASKAEAEAAGLFLWAREP